MVDHTTKRSFCSRCYEKTCNLISAIIKDCPSIKVKYFMNYGKYVSDYGVPLETCDNS